MYGHRAHFDWNGGPGIVGLIFFVVLIALAIVALIALVRMLRTPRPQTIAAVAPAARTEDGALAELRLRYARGEIDRDDFLNRLRDLGGQAPDNPPPAASAPSVNP